MISKKYKTVTEAIRELENEGYTTNFAYLTEEDKVVCNNRETILSLSEFEIDEVYRFEGMNDPGDEMILLAISAPNHQLKGVVVSAYGAYSSGLSEKITKRLKISESLRKDH